MNLCAMAGQPQIRETREMGIQSDDDARVNLVTANYWEFCDYPIVNAVSTCLGNSAASVCIYPLQYINVTVVGCDCVALVDSGCQIPIISEQLLSRCHGNAKSIVGTVVLYGYGKNHTVHAPLVHVTIHTQGTNQDDSTGIPLVCAVTDIGVAARDVILPAEIVRQLQVKSVSDNVSGCAVSDGCDVGTKFGDPKVDADRQEDVSNLPVYSVETNATD